VGAILSAFLVAGAVNGVGPLARVTPAAEVTDPREMLARSLQSVIDASSVHVVATLTGHVPSILPSSPDAPVVLDGTEAVLDLRPQDARSHVVFGSAGLGLQVEAITSWDTIAYRLNAGDWTKASLASLATGTKVDANPLALVDRLRSWLAAPGAPALTETDVTCDAPSGQCRRVVLSLAGQAGDIPLRAFPTASGATAGTTTTDVVLLTDAATLRPARLVVAVHNADGSLAVTAQADFTLWNWPSVIPDPPGG
jgi:hypothetical protein